MAVYFNTAFAQRFADQVPCIKRYTESNILDSLEGIKIYNPLIGAIGGDSIKFNCQGYNLQGWNEDYYISGKLLHRGFYVDGQLVTFKNFFENGQCERVVLNPDPLHCIENSFYSNGSPRKEINYYNGHPQRLVEYYDNGMTKYTEENEKNMNYLTHKKSWYSNGSVENSLELTDQRSKKYIQKSYYNNGQLREEGSVVFLTSTKEYMKEGSWLSYDSNGKNKQVKKYTLEQSKAETNQ